MMDEELDRAIMLLVSTLTRTIKSDDAYKITQSALNLAHVKSVLSGAEPQRKTKTAN
jgi:hypothetical protein